MDVEVAKHHLVYTVHQKGVKVEVVVSRQEDAGGLYTSTKVSIVTPRSASTARTLHFLGKRKGTEEEEAEEGLEREAREG